MFLRIEAPHFVAGIEVIEHCCSLKRFANNKPAPIISYMKDWGFEKIAEYCKCKNWNLQVLSDNT